MTIDKGKAWEDLKARLATGEPLLAMSNEFVLPHHIAAPLRAWPYGKSPIRSAEDELCDALLRIWESPDYKPRVIYMGFDTARALGIDCDPPPPPRSARRRRRQAHLRQFRMRGKRK